MDFRLETQQVKLTKSQLKQIVKEELEVVLKEQMPGPGAHAGRFPKHDPEKPEWIKIKSPSPSKKKDSGALSDEEFDAAIRSLPQDVLEKEFSPRERVGIKTPWMRDFTEFTKRHTTPPKPPRTEFERENAPKPLPTLKWPEASSDEHREAYLKTYKDPKGVDRLAWEKKVGKEKYENEILPWIEKVTYETPVEYKKMHDRLAGRATMTHLPGVEPRFDPESGTMIPGRTAGKLRQDIDLNLLPLGDVLHPPQEKHVRTHEREHVTDFSFRDPDAPDITGGGELSYWQNDLIDSMVGPALNKWAQNAFTPREEEGSFRIHQRPYMLEPTEIRSRVLDLRRRVGSGGFTSNDVIDICKGKLGADTYLDTVLDCSEDPEVMKDKMNSLVQVDMQQRRAMTEQQKIKFTKSQLKQIVKEELEVVLKEASLPKIKAEIPQQMISNASLMKEGFFENLLNTVGRALGTLLGDDNMLGKGPYNAPAETFEQATGVRGVSRSYKLPNDYKNEEDVQNKLDLFAHHDDAAPEIVLQRAMYNDLIELNSDLSGIPVKNDSDRYNVLFGAVSKINPSDIEFFLTLDPHRRAIAAPEYAEKKKRIEDKTGVDLYWYPSPETLENIFNQVAVQKEELEAVLNDYRRY